MHDIRSVQKTLVESRAKHKSLTDKYSVANEVCQLEEPDDGDFSLLLSGRLWLYYQHSVAKQL